MKYLALFTIFALAGIYFLDQGITGMVIGQSCCFPSENCPPEDVCETARLETPQPTTNYIEIVFGALAVIIFSFLIYKRIKNRQVVPISEIFNKS